MLYAVYITHFIFLCIFNKKKIIVEENADEIPEINNVNIINYNQVQVLSNNENRTVENK